MASEKERKRKTGRERQTERQDSYKKLKAKFALVSVSKFAPLQIYKKI